MWHFRSFEKGSSWPSCLTTFSAISLGIWRPVGLQYSADNAEESSRLPSVRLLVWSAHALEGGIVTDDVTAVLQTGADHEWPVTTDTRGITTDTPLGHASHPGGLGGGVSL